jgi:hypothetical protein
MKSMAELLSRLDRPGISRAVGRALVLETADAWLNAELPGLSGRARAKSQIGKDLVVQCSSGVIASEVKLRAARLLAHLREQYAAAAPERLKCLVRQSKVEDDEA